MGLAVRFWTKVQPAGANECWLWTRSVSNRGYGKFSVSDGIWRPAHVIAYELAHGATHGLWVLHSCDVRLCNPRHLFLGTAADNSADMTDKDRQCKGAEHPLAKLTDEKVVEMRRLYDTGEVSSLAELAALFEIGKQHAHRIVRRERWKHVP